MMVIIFYVGYASDEDIEKYLTRQKKLSCPYVPSPKKGRTLLDIPVEFVSKCEERAVGDAASFRSVCYHYPRVANLTCIIMAVRRPPPSPSPIIWGREGGDPKLVVAADRRLQQEVS